MATLAFDIGIVNMAMCVSENNLIRFCDVFPIGNAKDPLDKLIATLLVELRTREINIGHVIQVVIEQQLGRAASKNFAISAVLFSYFTDHLGDIAKVRFVNPRQKFKKLAALEGIPGITERAEEFKTTRGPKLKKLAIEASIALATHYGDTAYLQKLASMKKKDDLADSYCMSLCT